MAFVDSTTLTGQIAQMIYQDIFYGAPTLYGTLGFNNDRYKNGHVMIADNIKSTLRIPNILVNSGFVAPDCTFTPSSNFELTDKVLEPCRIDIKVEVCKDDFESIYNNEGMWALTPGALNSTMQAELLNVFLATHGMAQSVHAELLLWQGDTLAVDPGPSGEDLTLCDGFLKRFLSDGDVLDVASPTTLTVANIKGEFEKLFTTINPLVLQQHRQYGTGRIFVSPYTEQLLQLAIGQDYVNTPLLKEVDGVLVYLNWPIVSTYGIPDDVIVASYRDNLWVGTDLISDIAELQIIDMQPSTGDRKLRFLGSLRIGTQYFKGEYVTLYDGRTP